MNSASNLSDRLLNASIEAKASDIHFYPYHDHTDIFFRIQGKRLHYKKIRSEQYQVLLTYYKFISGMDIGESRKPQNGTIQQKAASRLFSLRISTLPLNNLESMAIRILPQDSSLTLEQLFLFPNQLKKLKQWTSNRAGIILLTGPTGSGKTTALYALLESILKEKSYQTITLEDPIEKDMENILQVQVNEKAGITYQTGLKAALRHDPDIIMVGEIRDKHIAEFAFEASLTGHLVLSTLHAKNAAGTVHRLLDMGIERSDLRQSLIAVAALQLLPIELDNIPTRRAAILELLDGSTLENVIAGKEDRKPQTFHSFEYLRKKAFAYGYISEENYFS
ncbi:competence type IV pilus ATPase ComGA [Oceanobacillus massiliensis]|uniref:competence type IV pilus ATPase ComGA n=1 Tax=Oceanobacillus massiliensis TaxID=1465765 RepID=UPI0002898BFB|nr:competence type IV pilus ATPase ComGA [Oceanobacillus massiliensis]